LKGNIYSRIVLWLIILSAFLGAFKIPLPYGSLELNLNVTQILFFVYIVFFLLTKIRNSFKFFAVKDWPSRWLVAYFLSNWFSSVFISHKSASFKGSMVILVYVGIYFTVRYIATYYTGFFYAVKKMVRFNWWSVLFGIGSMIFFIVLKPGSIIGVSSGHLTTGFPSIRSLSFEPNTFAISTAAVFCLIFSLHIYYPQKRTTKTWIMIILTGISILFSFTRSVYLALPLACFIIVWLSGKIPMTKVFVLIFIATIGLSTYVAFSDKNIVIESLASKLNNPFDQESGSTVGRLDAYATGINGFLKSPIVGNGTLSADTEILDQYTKQYKDQNGSSGWLTGFWIQSLHDTGIVGLLIGLGFLLSFIRTNYVCFKAEKESQFRKSLYLGFMASAIIIAICTQISNVMWISFTFVFWGINMALVKELNKKVNSYEKVKSPTKQLPAQQYA